MLKTRFLRRFFKAIALMTAVCLAVPSSACAFSTPPERLPAVSFQNGKNFVIPSSLGTLDEFKQGQSGKTFILIQDAHQSLEAQQHIAELIELLVSQHGIKTVFEEGYEGPVPTDELMKEVPELLLKQRVSYYLMDQLQIGGAEYAHINRFNKAARRPSLVASKNSTSVRTTSDERRATDNKTSDFKLIGADKLREHFDSVAWYGKAVKVQAQVDRDLSAAHKELQRLIPHFVSKPMRRLLKAKAAYASQKIDFIAYLRDIAGLAIETAGTMAFSMDYPGLTSAVKALDSKQAPAIEEVRRLAAQDLWRELEQLESDLEQRLLKTETEKAIVQFYSKLEALKRLNKIELTAGEYERIKTTLYGLKTQELADFIARHGKNTVVLSREWEDKIRYALEFYETALERDAAVREAAQSFLKNNQEQTAVLVYGGFHTGRIRETFQSLDVSFAVVSPRISRRDKTHEALYRDLMSTAQSPLNSANANQLSRPLSAIELRMNGSAQVRSEVNTQVLTLRKIMRGLPAGLSLPRAAREARLKLKTALDRRGEAKLNTVRSEVRNLGKSQSDFEAPSPARIPVKEDLRRSKRETIDELKEQIKKAEIAYRKRAKAALPLALSGYVAGAFLAFRVFSIPFMTLDATLGLFILGLGGSAGFGATVFLMMTGGLSMHISHLQRLLLLRDPKPYKTKPNSGVSRGYQKPEMNLMPPLQEGGAVYRLEAEHDPLSFRDLEDLGVVSTGYDRYSGEPFSISSRFNRTLTSAGERRWNWLLSHPFLDVHEIQERQKTVSYFILKPQVRKKLQQTLEEIGDEQDYASSPFFQEALRTRAAKKYFWIGGMIISAALLLWTGPLNLSWITAVFALTSLQSLWALLTRSPELRRVQNQLFSLKTVYDFLAALPDEGKSRNLLEIQRALSVISDSEHPDTLMPLRGSLNASQFQKLFSDPEIITRYQKILGAVGELDAYQAIAQMNIDHEMQVMPEMLEQGTPSIVLEDVLHPTFSMSEAFVANSLAFDRSQEGLHLITAPNGTGKSTLIRTVVLNFILAQIGSMVPAKMLKMTPIKIRTHINLEDSLAEGQSRFITETRLMRDHLASLSDDPRTFVIFAGDEIFEGTNPRDRFLIQVAAIRYMVKKGVIGLIATHDLDLVKVFQGQPGISMKHFRELPDGKADFQLMDGPAEGTNALDVVRRGNFPDDFMAELDRVTREFARSEVRNGDSSQVQAALPEWTDLRWFWNLESWQREQLLHGVPGGPSGFFLNGWKKDTFNSTAEPGIAGLVKAWPRFMVLDSGAVQWHVNDQSENHRPERNDFYDHLLAEFSASAAPWAEPFRAALTEFWNTPANKERKTALLMGYLKFLTLLDVQKPYSRRYQNLLRAFTEFFSDYGAEFGWGRAGSSDRGIFQMLDEYRESFLAWAHADMIDPKAMILLPWLLPYLMRGNLDWAQSFKELIKSGIVYADYAIAEDSLSETAPSAVAPQHLLAAYYAAHPEERERLHRNIIFEALVPAGFLKASPAAQTLLLMDLRHWELKHPGQSPNRAVLEGLQENLVKYLKREGRMRDGPSFGGKLHFSKSQISDPQLVSVAKYLSRFYALDFTTGLHISRSFPDEDVAGFVYFPYAHDPETFIELVRRVVKELTAQELISSMAELPAADRHLWFQLTMSGPLDTPLVNIGLTNFLARPYVLPEENWPEEYPPAFQAVGFLIHGGHAIDGPYDPAQRHDDISLDYPVDTSTFEGRMFDSQFAEEVRFYAAAELAYRAWKKQRAGEELTPYEEELAQVWENPDREYVLGEDMPEFDVEDFTGYMNLFQGLLNAIAQHAGIPNEQLRFKPDDRHSWANFRKTILTLDQESVRQMPVMMHGRKIMIQMDHPVYPEIPLTANLFSAMLQEAVIRKVRDIQNKYFGSVDGVRSEVRSSSQDLNLRPFVNALLRLDYTKTQSREIYSKIRDRLKELYSQPIWHSYLETIELDSNHWPDVLITGPTGVAAAPSMPKLFEFLTTYPDLHSFSSLFTRLLGYTDQDNGQIKNPQLAGLLYRALLEGSGAPLQLSRDGQNLEVKITEDAAEWAEPEVTEAGPREAKYTELLSQIEEHLAEGGHAKREVRLINKYDASRHLRVVYARQPSGVEQIRAATLDIKFFPDSQKAVIHGESDVPPEMLPLMLEQLRAQGVDAVKIAKAKLDVKTEISLAGEDWRFISQQVLDTLRQIRVELWQHLYADSELAVNAPQPLDGLKHVPNFPVPSPAKLIQFYDGFGADGWKRPPGAKEGGIPIGMTHLGPEIQKWYLNLIHGFGRNLKILELGPGHGELAQVLKAEGHQVTTVELSPKNAALVRQKGVEVLIGDANQKLDLPHDFDLVIMIDSIGQMDPQRVIQNSKIYLRPGGSILITTPTTDTPMTRQSYDATLQNRYPIAHLDQILRGHRFDHLMQGYIPLSNTDPNLSHMFLQYIHAHKPLRARSEQRPAEQRARSEVRSVLDDSVAVKRPPALRVTGGAKEIEDFIKINSQGHAVSLGDKLVSVEMITNDMANQLVFDLVFVQALGRANIQATQKWDRPEVLRELKFETDDLNLKQQYSAEILRLMLLFFQKKYENDADRRSFEELALHITLKQGGGTATALPGFERLLMGWAKDPQDPPYSFDEAEKTLHIFLSKLDLSKPQRSEVRSGLIQFGKMLGWSGIGLSALLSMIYLYPILPAYAAKAFIQGWAITLLALGLNRLGSYESLQFVLLIAGLAGIFGVFHLLNQLPFEWGAVALNTGIRSASVFFSAWGGETLQHWRYQTKPKESLAKRFHRYTRWSLAIGLASGPYIFDVALPFFKTAIQNVVVPGLTLNFSTALLRTAFDLGVASIIMHTWLMLVLGAVFGEKQDVLKDFKKVLNPREFFKTATWKKFLFFTPFSFLIWVLPLFFAWYFLGEVSLHMKVIQAFVSFGWGVLLKTVVSGPPSDGQNSAASVRPALARSEVRSAMPGILQSGLRRNFNDLAEQSLRSSGRKPQREGGRSEVRVEGNKPAKRGSPFARKLIPDLTPSHPHPKQTYRISLKDKISIAFSGGHESGSKDLLMHDLNPGKVLKARFRDIHADLAGRPFLVAFSSVSDPPALVAQGLLSGDLNTLEKALAEAETLYDISERDKVHVLIGGHQPFAGLEMQKTRYLHYSAAFQLTHKKNLIKKYQEAVEARKQIIRKARALGFRVIPLFSEKVGVSADFRLHIPEQTFVFEEDLWKRRFDGRGMTIEARIEELKEEVGNLQKQIKAASAEMLAKQNQILVVLEALSQNAAQEKKISFIDGRPPLMGVVNNVFLGSGGRVYVELEGRLRASWPADQILSVDVRKNSEDKNFEGAAVRLSGSLSQGFRGLGLSPEAIAWAHRMERTNQASFGVERPLSYWLENIDGMGTVRLGHISALDRHRLKTYGFIFPVADISPQAHVLNLDLSEELRKRLKAYKQAHSKYNILRIDTLMNDFRHLTASGRTKVLTEHLSISDWLTLIETFFYFGADAVRVMPFQPTLEFIRNSKDAVPLIGHEPFLTLDGMPLLTLEDRESILDLPISALHVEPSVENLLFEEAHIERLRDLRLFSNFELRLLPSFGEKSFEEFRQAKETFKSRLQKKLKASKGGLELPVVKAPGYEEVRIADFRMSMPVRKMLMDAGFRTVAAFEKATEADLRQAGLWNTWALLEIEEALQALTKEAPPEKAATAVFAEPESPAKKERALISQGSQELRQMTTRALYQELMSLSPAHDVKELAGVITHKQRERRIQLFTEEQNKMRYFFERITGVSFQDYRLDPEDLDAIYEDRFYERLLSFQGREEDTLFWHRAMVQLVRDSYAEWITLVMPQHKKTAVLISQGLRKIFAKEPREFQRPKLTWTPEEVLAELLKQDAFTSRKAAIRAWMLSLFARTADAAAPEVVRHRRRDARIRRLESLTQTEQAEQAAQLMALIPYRQRQGLELWLDGDRKTTEQNAEYESLLRVGRARISQLALGAVSDLQESIAAGALLADQPRESGQHPAAFESAAETEEVFLAPFDLISTQPEKDGLSEEEELWLIERIRSQFPQEKERRILARVLEHKTWEQTQAETGTSTPKDRAVYGRAVSFARRITMLSAIAQRGVGHYALAFIREWLREQDLTLTLAQREWKQLYRVSGGDTELLRELFLQAMPNLKSKDLEKAVQQISFSDLHPGSASTLGWGTDKDEEVSPAEVEMAVHSVMVHLGVIPKNRREGLQRRILRDLYYRSVLRDHRKSSRKTLDALHELSQQTKPAADDPERTKHLKEIYGFYDRGIAFSPEFLKQPDPESIEPVEPLRLDQTLSIYEQKQHLESETHAVMNAGQARIGKTISSVLAMLNVETPGGEKNVNRILYTTSKSAMYAVKDELDRRLDTAQVKVFVIDGDDKKQWLEEIDKASAAAQSGFKVILIGSYDRNARFENELKTFAPDGHIIDEVENLRGGYKTIRAPKVFGIPARYRMAISARFIVNRQKDIIQALVWLRSGQAIQNEQEWKQAVLAFQHLSQDEVFGVLDSLMVRWRRHTVLPELGEPKEIRVSIPYSTLQRKTIDAMRADTPKWLANQARPELKDQDTHLLNRIKLERWASADLRLVLPESATQKKTIDQLSPKTARLIRTLKREFARDGKVLVMYDFVDGIDALVEQLNGIFGKDTAIGLNGGLTLKARNDAIKKFRGEAQPKVLIGTHELLGSSLNLFQLPGKPFHISTLVRMSESWMPYDDGDRLIGPGQTHPVRVITYVSTSPDMVTVEERLHTLVNGKRKLLAHARDGKPELTAAARKGFEAILPTAKSEVRQLPRDRLLPDEEASYRRWEDGFEKERRLKGAVLQIALERQKIRVRQLMRQYGQKNRRQMKTLLEKYGFAKPAGTNGPYEFAVPVDVRAGLQDAAAFLPKERSDFIRERIVVEAIELIMRENQFIPEELVDEASYKHAANYYFWKTVSPRLIDLFEPLREGKKTVTWQALRSVVLDLWASIRVLQDIQENPLNGYHEPSRLISNDHVLAAALMNAGFAASAEQRFSVRDLPKLKRLQLDLERLHFQLAEQMIEFERSLAVSRSEIRRGDEEDSAQNAFAVFDRSYRTRRAAMINFDVLRRFSNAEIREAAIVMKQRSEVRFVIYNADPAQDQLLHFKQLFDFRNVAWTASRGETAFQALGPQFKEGSVVGFSRGGQDSKDGFSARSLKKMRRFKLSARKPGTMAAALSFDPDDPRYSWGILREGDFYVVSDPLASIAGDYLSRFVFAASA